MPCGRIGSTELLLLALVIIVLFGARRLPEIGAGLGQGIKGFKKAMRDDDKDDKNDPSRRVEQDRNKDA